MKIDEIKQGDCLEQLGKIPNCSFDMSFADPPFNLSKKYETYKDNITEQEYLVWCRAWITELVRVTKPNGTILLHNIPKWLCHFSTILNDLGMQFRHWIAWDAPSRNMGHSLQPAHYGILYYTKSSSQKVYEVRTPHKRCINKKCYKLLKDYGGKKCCLHPFGPLVSDVWTDIFRCKHKKYKDEHPCQLPIHLLERLILLCTDADDLVFDCFLGSGCTAVAAKRLGRHYYGIELSDRYIEIIHRNLSHSIESKIGDMWVSCYLNRIHTVRDCDIYDMALKQYKQAWKSLFNNWKDDHREIFDTTRLEYTPEVLKQLHMICERRENAQEETRWI